MKYNVLTAAFGLAILLVCCTTTQPQTSIRTESDVHRIIPKSDYKVIDSLRIDPALGEVRQREYKGVIPSASGCAIEYTLLLYNQPHCGDGVYRLTQRYIEADKGKDTLVTTYGRQYTLRGDAVDIDATVYQLIPFTSSKAVNLLRLPDGLELLNKKLERADSKLNYTLRECQ